MNEYEKKKVNLNTPKTKRKNLIKLFDKNNNENNNISENDKIALLKIINNIILKTKNNFKNLLMLPYIKL